MLIQNDVSHGEFAALAKRAYVDVVYEHFSISGSENHPFKSRGFNRIKQKIGVDLTKEKKGDFDTPKGAPNHAIQAQEPA